MPTFINSYADCYEVYKYGRLLPGIYILQTGPAIYIKAKCLEGGWTVIQSRGNYENSIDYFLKGWEKYVNGFGDPSMSSGFF